MIKDQFLQGHKLPMSTQEEIGKLNSPGALKEIKFLVKNEEGNPAGLSSCSGGLRPLVELCVEPAGLCGRCTGVAVPLLMWTT